MVVHLSMFLYSLSFLLIANGLPALLKDPESPYRYIYSAMGLMKYSGQIPYLMTFRDSSGSLFLAHRMATHPFIYKWLHIVPAVAWSILLPLQHVQMIRRRAPSLHRFSGYFVATMSVLLAITGLAFPFLDLSHSESGAFKLHAVPGYPWLIYPTFNQSLFIIAPAQLFSLYKSVCAARSKQFGQHEFWSKMHTIAAYVIHLDRVGFMIMFLVGGMCQRYERSQEHFSICEVPRTSQQIQHYEMIGFQLSAFFGGIIGFFWALATYIQHMQAKAIKVE